MDQATISDAIAATIARRNAARAEMHKAERELAAAGVALKDGEHGTTWSLVELLETDRDDARAALLETFRRSCYGEGMVQCLLSDLKAIKAAR